MRIIPHPTEPTIQGGLYVHPANYKPQRAVPCPHLGPQRTNKEGVKLKVKCGCSKKHQERQVPAHTCEVFKRCLPSVRFDQKQIEEWNQRDESAMYAICQLCPIQEG